MTLSDEMAADAAQIFDAFGSTITWKGRTLRALVSEPTLGQDLATGGFVDTGDFSVKLLRNGIAGDLPKHGDLIELEGETFRITRVMDRPGHPFLVLTVSPPDE